MSRKKYTYEVMEDLGDGNTKIVYIGNNVTDAADLYEDLSNRGHSMIWNQYFGKED